MSRAGLGGDRGLDLRETAAYDYFLPADRVAKYPTERRNESRLLVVPRGPEKDRAGQAGKTLPVGPPLRDLHFSDFPSLLSRGDVLVLNESRVLPARLLGRKPTGAACEVLLIRPVRSPGATDGPERWEALVRPGTKLKPGRTLLVSDELSVVVEDGLPGGRRTVRLETDLPVETALERYGRVPLPPYLDREDEAIDRERYQTVYARTPGSVAAPTAGLHFTSELIDGIRDLGVEVASVNLHVGPGTFRPVESESTDAHVMHGERWSVPAAAAETIQRARGKGGRVWAVGTTVVRTLETAAGPTGQVELGEGDTDLFIRPGFTFRVVDGLLTNFHLPRSTLLMLVAAFAGFATIRSAYAHAIGAGYRFYSYGDAMAIVPEGRETR